MATLTVNSIQKSGIADLDAVLVAAAALGDDYPASSGTFVVMKNADVSPHTLTVAAPSSTTDSDNLGELAVEDITLIVAAADVGFVSIPAGYVDGSGNYAWTYDAETSVTVGVFSIAP